MNIRGAELHTAQDDLLPSLTPQQQSQVIELCGEIDGVLADGPSRSSTVTRGTELIISGTTVAINQEVPISNPEGQLMVQNGQAGTDYWFSKQIYDHGVDVRTWICSSDLVAPVILPSNTGANREDFFDPFTRTIVAMDDVKYWAKLDQLTEKIKNLLDEDSQVSLYDSWTLPEQSDAAVTPATQDSIVELNKAYLWRAGSITDTEKTPLIGRSVLFWAANKEGSPENTSGVLLYLQQKHPWAEVYLSEDLTVSPYFFNAEFVNGLTRLVRDIRLTI